MHISYHPEHMLPKILEMLTNSFAVLSSPLTSFTTIAHHSTVKLVHFAESNGVYNWLRTIRKKLICNIEWITLFPTTGIQQDLSLKKPQVKCKKKITYVQDIESQE